MINFGINGCDVSFKGTHSDIANESFRMSIINSLLTKLCFVFQGYIHWVINESNVEVKYIWVTLLIFFCSQQITLVFKCSFQLFTIILKVIQYIEFAEYLLAFVKCDWAINKFLGHSHISKNFWDYFKCSIDYGRKNTVIFSETFMHCHP